MHRFIFIKALIALVLTEVVSQLIKVINETIKNKKFSFKYIILDGGIPSSHSALIGALITVSIFYSGWSLITLITIGFSVIVLRDSFGVRLEVGKHKLILESIAKKQTKKFHLMREGHTPRQVIVGFFLGIICMTIFLSVL